MKIRLIISCLAALAIASCATGDKKEKPASQQSSGSAVKEYWDDKSLKGVGPKQGGLKTGKWTLFHMSSGEKQGEGEYLNDQQTGMWTFYHKNGAISAKGEFLEGQKTGEWIMYYDSGEIMNKARYVIKETDAGMIKLKVGGIEGLKISYFKNGKVWKEEDHRNGLKNGRSQEYFENGNPKEISMFKENVYDGQFNEWFSNAKKKAEGFYVKGAKSGKWNFYHDNGQLFIRGAFKENKPEGSWMFYARDGRLMKSGNYDAGKESGLWSFFSYETGKQQLAMELALTGGMATGADCKIYAKGSLAGIGGVFGLPKAIFVIMLNGVEKGTVEASDPLPDDPAKKAEYRWSGKWAPLKKNGVWKVYYPGAKQVKQQFTYMMDKLAGKYSEYYPSGKLKAQGEYQLDKMNGTWTFYREDGSVDEAQSGMYLLGKKTK